MAHFARIGVFALLLGACGGRLMGAPSGDRSSNANEADGAAAAGGSRGTGGAAVEASIGTGGTSSPTDGAGGSPAVVDPGPTWTYADDGGHRVIGLGVDPTGLFVLQGREFDCVLEKHSLDDGTLVTAFGQGGRLSVKTSDVVCGASHIPTDESGVYLGLLSHLQKLDKTTGAIVWDVPMLVDAPAPTPGALFVDAFIGLMSPPTYWRIDKLSVDTGTRVPGFVPVDRPAGNNAGRVAADADGLVVFDTSMTGPQGGPCFHTRMLALTDASTLWDAAECSTYADDMAANSAGVYLIQNAQIEKRDRRTGALGGLLDLDANNGAVAVAADDTGVYISGYVVDGVDSWWWVTKRHAADLTPVADFGTAGVLVLDPTTPGTLGVSVKGTATRIAVDGANMYVAGEQPLGFRIEKRRKLTGEL